MDKILIGFCSLIFLFTISCTSDTHEESSLYFANVDAALWTYFDAFEKEGIKRGYNVDLSAAEITGEIRTISEDGVAGTCQFGTHIHHVTIDKEFWDKADYNLREYVVFHELGHCALDRGHNNRAFANGNCVSIMHSGLTDCRVTYGTQTRSALLDELFQNE